MKYEIELEISSHVYIRLFGFSFPMSDSLSLNELNKRIMNHKYDIIKDVLEKLQLIDSTSVGFNYKIIWNAMQSLAIETIEEILTTEFKEANFYVTDSKSTYPDLKMRYNKFTIAIDIKSSIAQKDPWYDIARLDTVLDSRIYKFDEEYDIIIKYDKESKKVINVYFELLRDTVGKTKDGDVKYRPYDGKLRPKNWKDFENEVTYWNNKEEFIQGIKRTRIQRWKREIIKMIPVLTDNEKVEFKKLFC